MSDGSLTAGNEMKIEIYERWKLERAVNMKFRIYRCEVWVGKPLKIVLAAEISRRNVNSISSLIASDESTFIHRYVHRICILKRS